MENLIIDKTVSTPKISLNAQTGFLDFVGDSFPEDVMSFYNPILEWLDNYFETPAENSVIKLHFGYLNSSSSKLILFILKEAQKFYEAKGKIKIEWYYDEEDEDMQDSGEFYQKLIKAPIKLIATDN